MVFIYLFYLQILSIPEPAFPPPPPPMPTSAPSAPSLPPAGGYSNGPHDGGGGRPGGGDSHLEPQASYEEWDEDWDSDDGDSTTGALSSSIGQVKQDGLDNDSGCAVSCHVNNAIFIYSL